MLKMYTNVSARTVTVIFRVNAVDGGCDQHCSKFRVSNASTSQKGAPPPVPSSKISFLKTLVAGRQLDVSEEHIDKPSKEPAEADCKVRLASGLKHRTGPLTLRPWGWRNRALPKRRALCKLHGMNPRYSAPRGRRVVHLSFRLGGGGGCTAWHTEGVS
jgi:hypothetical protein